jgi:arginase
MAALARDRTYAIVEAPSTYGLSAAGVEQLPSALLAHGLASRLPSRQAGRVQPKTPRSTVRDSKTTVLNAQSIADYAKSLADAVSPLLDAQEFPFVLGGDCTIILGPMLALRRRGRYGLLFIDGQADFFQPEAEPNGEAASMDLALVTGHGPALLTNLEGRAPLVRDTDAVAFGFRDTDDQIEYGSQPLPDALRAFDLPTIERTGIEAAAQQAIEHVSRRELDGFWIHVDADCLDDAVMPAVDFRLPGGLTPQQLEIVLKMALSSDRAVGLEVTIYNPTLDSDGRAGRVLTDVLVNSLS